MCRRSRVNGFSASTRTPTSIELRQAALTVAVQLSSSATATGSRNVIRSSPAVTTRMPQCLIAASPAASSMKRRTVPPWIEPAEFASWTLIQRISCEVDSEACRGASPDLRRRRVGVHGPILWVRGEDAGCGAGGGPARPRRRPRGPGARRSRPAASAGTRRCRGRTSARCRSRARSSPPPRARRRGRCAGGPGRRRRSPRARRCRACRASAAARDRPGPRSRTARRGRAGSASVRSQKTEKPGSISGWARNSADDDDERRRSRSSGRSDRLAAAQPALRRSGAAAPSPAARTWP